MSSVTQTGKHQSAEQARAEHETTTPAHRKRHLAVAVSVAALGGLLFGYDTGIIASAQLYFVPEFGLSSTMQEVAVASLLAGAVVGVLIGGPVTDRFGRKKTLGVVAAVFIVGSVVSALAPDVEVLIGARALLGLCIGASSLAVPSYIAEISPPAIRGRLVSMNQMLVMSGIFIAYLVGFAFESTKGWRWMLGIGVVPATLMLIGIPFIVESPRWLLDHGRPDQARSVMTRLLPPEVIDQQMQEITEATQAEEHISYRYLLNRSMRPAILLGVVVAATNQLVGVNAILYYTPTLLRRAGLGDSASLISTVGLGAAGVIFTLGALLSIDKLGRRPLLLSGTAGVTVLLVLIGALYQLPSTVAVNVALVAALVAYEAVFSASLGIAIWLINSEIFPTAVRAKAAGFGTITHWGLDFIISITVLTLISAITPSGLFWVFAVFGGLGFAYLYRNLPETRGRTLEDIETALRQRGSAAND